jgi:hypothetical protein
VWRSPKQQADELESDPVEDRVVEKLLDETTVEPAE